MQMSPLPIDVSTKPRNRSFAQLACYAATELDGLAARKLVNVDAISEFNNFLANRVEKQLSENIDTHTITVLSWAFADSKLLEPSAQSTLSELLTEAGKLLKELRLVAAQPSNYVKDHITDLERLRDVCLSLSRQALASEYSFINDEASNANIN